MLANLSFMQNDPVWMLSRLLDGEALPFDWVVEHVGDGDMAAAVRRVWRTSRNAYAMLYVARHANPLLTETLAGAREMVREFVRTLPGRSARKHLYAELDAAEHSQEYLDWRRRGWGGARGWINQLPQRARTALEMVRAAERSSESMSAVARVSPATDEDAQAALAVAVRRCIPMPDPTLFTPP